MKRPERACGDISKEGFYFELEREKEENMLSSLLGTTATENIIWIVRGQPKEKQIELYKRTIKDIIEHKSAAEIYRDCNTIKQMEDAHKLISII